MVKKKNLTPIYVSNCPAFLGHSINNYYNLF